MRPIQSPLSCLSEVKPSEIAGVFPRGLGQVSKLRKQIKAYVNGQLDACTQPDPEHPKAHFKVSCWPLGPVILPVIKAGAAKYRPDVYH